jgi:predicted unusual protein kinase regulating ubiquinone biosynthesis (AarF/ABC1/UbiB family)
MTDSGDPMPRGRVRRTMPLAGFTARAAGGRLVAGLREKSGDVGAVERFHERTAERYAELLGHSKGVLMKAGQLLSGVDASSIGNGGFSPYQKALTRLQADAPPMHPGLVKEVLEADLDRATEQVFAEFTALPMAAASIGQVHRAVLHDGREVAVKVQYPGAAEAIRDDLANTELLSTFLRFAVAASGNAMAANPRQMTREIAARIAEEIDYRHEAANITAFSELYRDHPFIRVPKVIQEASGDRVLTMTYLDGMDWAAAQQADQELKNTWAEVILRFVHGSYRHANLFNADPHPGNYRFGSDGTVAFVDFGCVKVLPEHTRHSYVAMTRAALDGRKHEMRQLMDELGYFAAGATLSAEEAYRWMAELAYETLAPQPVTVGHDSPERAIRALFDLRPSDHPVRRISVSDDLIFFPRMSINMSSMLAALEATVYARAIVDDLDGLAAPTTPLGELHNAWLRHRSLPYGLERHDAA